MMFYIGIKINSTGNNMEDGILYSTEQGAMCPKCNRQKNKCNCKEKKKNEVKGSGNVRVSRETKGRKGKGVSLVTGLPLNDFELAQLGKKLKQKCGTGGTVKNGVIEIQGDMRDKLVELLALEGYKAKKSGG